MVTQKVGSTDDEPRRVGVLMINQKVGSTDDEPKGWEY